MFNIVSNCVQHRLIMLANQPEYSAAEVKLFTALGHADLLEHLTEMGLWDFTVKKVFIEKREGPEVEALRRGYKAISECKIWRMTAEFDALITF